jgi:hypothetical protein
MKLQLLFLAAALGGCALMEHHETAATERLLVQAGFQMRAAESGERDLPRREIATLWDGEKTRYLYADPDGCRCVYAGGTAQYERYRWLEARENVFRETDGAAMNAASIDAGR